MTAERTMMRKAQLVVKRAIDIAVALILTLLLSPALLTIALAILFTTGRPIFFTQPRIGMDERTFRIWKFRTMVQDADKLLRSDLTAPAPRVTKLGAWLRRWSFDELPQLVNILRGDMSIVGPRATLPEVHAKFSPDQKRRCRMRPGVTGLAQVSGRNEIPWSMRTALDNRYIDEYSLLLDAKVLFRTVSVWATGSGFELDRTQQRIDTTTKREGP